MVENRYLAFSAGRRIADGDLATVAVAAWRAREGAEPVLVFESATAKLVELDLRGGEADVAARYAPLPEVSAPVRGRPKLGVTAREVTLLPRHWDWLAAQPGGASVTLRRLVEAARKADLEEGGPRERTEATYRFLLATAGDRPGFEEMSRALFAGNRERFIRQMAAWPQDICDEALRYLDGD
jgi:hypothetical protein